VTSPGSPQSHGIPQHFQVPKFIWLWEQKAPCHGDRASDRASDGPAPLSPLAKPGPLAVSGTASDSLSD
jgi:hypothetical protein